jgi:hypothetical protein
MKCPVCEKENLKSRVYPGVSMRTLVYCTPYYDEDGNYQHMSETSQKYAKLIYSNKNVIDMIDPSGGPYMHSGHDMGMFDKSFKGMIIKEFKSVPEGYLIVIEKS